MYINHPIQVVLGDLFYAYLRNIRFNHCYLPSNNCQLPLAL